MTSQIHPSDIAETPDLRLAPCELLVEHEYPDPRTSQYLVEHLEADGVLVNPLVVCSMGDDDPRFMVLDGANRIAALRQMGYPHALVQVVAYAHPTVTVTTWHHVISCLDSDKLLAGLASVPAVEVLATDLLHARAGLARRQYLLYLIRADGYVFAVRARQAGEVHDLHHLLNALVDTYVHHCELHRVMNDNLPDALVTYPELSAIVVFPNYQAVEILSLARDGELLPTGLTRYFIQGRALRVNYPLSELKSAEPISVKQQRLQEWVRRKLTTKEVRFYGEMTYLFDE